MVWVFQEGHFGSLFNDLTDDRLPRADDAAADVLPRVRAVDGLRGVPALAHPRGVAGVRPHDGRQHRRRSRSGLGRTGRIVTAAALLMAIVFAAMAASKVSFMMLFGTGLTLAVLMDATVVRGIAGAGLHAARRPVELVGAAPAGPAARPLRAVRGPAAPADRAANWSESRDRRSRKAAPRRRASRGARRASCARRSSPRPRSCSPQAGDADAVSIRAVADAVGVTPPSIYLHFADKDELIEAVVADVFAELDAAMLAAAESARTPARAAARVRPGLRPLRRRRTPSTTGWRRWSAARRPDRRETCRRGARRRRRSRTSSTTVRDVHGRRDLRRRRPAADDAASCGRPRTASRR